MFRFRGTVTWAEPGNRMLARRSRIGVAFEQIADEYALCLEPPLVPVAA